MILKIRCDSPLFDALRLAVVTTIEAHRQAGTLDEDNYELSWEADPKPRKAAAAADPARARIHYRARLPEGTPEQVRAAIRTNVEAFGGITVKARIYQGLANAALRGDWLTEADIRNVNELTKGPCQRVIGELQRADFVVAEPVQ